MNRYIITTVVGVIIPYRFETKLYLSLLATLAQRVTMFSPKGWISILFSGLGISLSRVSRTPNR